MPAEQAWQATNQRSQVGPGDRQGRSRSENLQGACSGPPRRSGDSDQTQNESERIRARFGILPSTLRDWEQNRRHSDGAARVPLMVIDKKPDARAG